MSDAQQFYVVGAHGAPTPETAPHGYRWRAVHTDGSKQEWQPWDVTVKHWDRNFVDSTEWAPLPAPPTEQAPPPEPVARWTSHYDNRGMWVLLCEGSPNFTKDEAAHILKTLNTLDRDGVAWGPGRPMSELPETGRVIVQLRNRGASIVWAEDIREAAAGTYLGWWPQPLPGEAAT